MKHYHTLIKHLLRTTSFGTILIVSAIAPIAHGAIGWEGGGGTNWWFDPANWSQSANNLIPTSQLTDGVVIRTDAQINIGTGDWDITGEGVVYDPENDPFFEDAASLEYPTGSSLANLAGVMRDYGPETLYRFYVSRNTTNTNIVTIKSGDLVIENLTMIGRSGSSEGAQNLGMIVQTGGSLRLPVFDFDIGQREASGWGNGVYDYRGGILDVAQQTTGSRGIRLSAGSDGTGAGGHGRFIMHNPTTPGRVRTLDFTVAQYGGPTGGNPALDPDGINTGVGIVEFHFENGGTRPIQVERNLQINNGLHDNMSGIRSSRLELKLNEPACTGEACVPVDLGLFDVNFGDFFSGSITGTGDLSGDGFFDNDRVFSNADGTVHYREGDMVSASFGSVLYNWTISYTGNITWANADDSVVDQIQGPGTGTDVVLIGHSSEVLPGIPGDFDGDGVVDGHDLLHWQRNPAIGNLSDWQDNFGTSQMGTMSLSGAMQAVPEPTSLVLLCLGLVPVAFRRGGRS